MSVDYMTLLIAANYYASPDCVPYDKRYDDLCDAIAPRAASSPTRVVIECTAAGSGNSFYDQWRAS